MAASDILLLVMAMLAMLALVGGLGVALTYLDNAEEAENR